jgi:hypothetical protein
VNLEGRTDSASCVAEFIPNQSPNVYDDIRQFLNRNNTSTARLILTWNNNSEIQVECMDDSAIKILFEYEVPIQFDPTPRLNELTSEKKSEVIVGFRGTPESSFKDLKSEVPLGEFSWGVKEIVELPYLHWDGRSLCSMQAHEMSSIPLDLREWAEKNEFPITDHWRFNSNIPDEEYVVKHAFGASRYSHYALEGNPEIVGTNYIFSAGNGDFFAVEKHKIQMREVVLLQGEQLTGDGVWESQTEDPFSETVFPLEVEIIKKTPFKIEFPEGAFWDIPVSNWSGKGFYQNQSLSRWAPMIPEEASKVRVLTRTQSETDSFGSVMSIPFSLLVENLETVNSALATLQRFKTSENFEPYLRKIHLVEGTLDHLKSLTALKFINGKPDEHEMKVSGLNFADSPLSDSEFSELITAIGKANFGNISVALNPDQVTPFLEKINSRSNFVDSVYVSHLHLKETDKQLGVLCRLEDKIKGLESVQVEKCKEHEDLAHFIHKLTSQEEFQKLEIIDTELGVEVAAFEALFKSEQFRTLGLELKGNSKLFSEKTKTIQFLGLVSNSGRDKTFVIPKIDLDNYSFQDGEVDQLVEGLKRIKGLKTFYLRDVNTVQSESIRILSTLNPPHRNLEKLDLVRHNFYGLGKELKDSLQHLSNLKTLYLHGIGFSAEEALRFSEEVHNFEELKTLSYSVPQAYTKSNFKKKFVYYGVAFGAFGLPGVGVTYLLMGEGNKIEQLISNLAGAPNLEKLDLYPDDRADLAVLKDKIKKIISSKKDLFSNIKISIG